MISNILNQIKRSLIGGVALVAVSVPSAQAGDWSYSVTPYLWGSGLSGQSKTVAGVPPVEIDASFSDILNNLDFAGMATFNANNGQFGVSGDFQYYKLSTASDSLNPKFGSATINQENIFISLFGDYLLSRTSGSELWLSGGLRYWSVETNINLAAGTSPARSANGSNHWVDPVIGLRGRTSLGEKTFLTGWAYGGGFGVGSEEMYDLFGGIGYQFTDTVSAIAGYRWMSVDRVDGDFIYDTVQDGLMMGVTFNF